MKQPSVCPYAGRCGGCDMISLPYGDTLALKQRRMSGLLSSFGPVLPIVPMDNPLYYRNKVHRVFSSDRRGRVHCGNYQAGTHFVVDIDHCLIEDEASQAVIRTVRDLAVSFRIPIYDEDRGTGLLRHVMVRRGFATGEMLVILVLAKPVFPGKKHFVEALRKAHPEITGIVLNVNGRATTMVLGDRNLPLFGASSIRDVLCGLTFRLSPGTFYQVNPVQTEKLYRLAVDWAGLTGRETVLDAYCGIGTIGLSAASRAGKVIGVELNPDAVRDARLNVRENGVGNASFFQADAGAFIDRMASSGQSADVIMLDPPRSGSTEKFLAACARLAPRNIVYISCGPDTLRRDLLFLKSRGYAPVRIRPVDMFPFTSHVETVVLMSKVGVE